ncbi:hypothetical protein BGZ61DRAFT_483143 [Ilyonectria robusta]|uniref:uncharacterized protein n=1 Tax=Ilyonectria robusta TaxID=1079257 RepID=UPI001E8D8A10|nr:uncharacterized protein BGZ61DRAFT_483143 [Ilyonectria robusta]KAH8669834.1 hypothetical protein BGZ61DRAFT_483143 [Ilyonectria robusta]
MFSWPSDEFDVPHLAPLHLDPLIAGRSVGMGWVVLLCVGGGAFHCPSLHAAVSRRLGEATRPAVGEGTPVAVAVCPSFPHCSCPPASHPRRQRAHASYLCARQQGVEVRMRRGTWTLIPGGLGVGVGVWLHGRARPRWIELCATKVATAASAS